MVGHTSEKRWRTVRSGDKNYTGISEVVSEISNNLVVTLLDVEEKYLELLEIYNYAGGTTTDLANLLFKEDIEARAESVANAEEIAKATDLVAAVTAAHEVFQCANNVTTTQEDRLSKLRRMS